MIYQSSLTRAALRAGAATAALTLALAANAQSTVQTTQATGAAAPAPEEIVVTGSRIARPDLESASPVSVIGAQEFAFKGTPNVEQVLNDLPQFIPNTTAFSNNPGDGSALIDLRGLGAGRNLVLVNGRRWVSYNVTQIVDINTIPGALIERTEVLTGGRSAVYGSDAISGVVNFVLKKDFQGVRADAQYGITGRGDGGTFNGDLTIGGNFADGRGNATVFFSYINRDPILQSERPFSRFTLSEAGDGTTFNGGSGSVPGTRFSVGQVTGSPLSTVNTGTFFTIPATQPALPDGTRQVPIIFSGIGNRLFLRDGSFRPYSGTTDAFNFAPDNYLQLPQERYLFGGFANYEVNEHLDVYTEVTHINNRVPTQLAATPITGNFLVPTSSPFYSASTAAQLQAFDQGEAVARLTNNALPQSATNRVVTDANGLTVFDRPLATTRPLTITNGNITNSTLAGDGRTFINIGRRLQEVGPRISNNERQASRYLLGVRGEIAGDWRYDGYFTYARTVALENQAGNVSRSRFQQALLGCPAGSAPGCAPLNIFGEGNISQAAANFIRVDTKNQTTITEQVANFAVSNSNLFDLGFGADPVGVAFGGEYRQIDGDFLPDFVLSSGDVVGFNGQTPTRGGYNVKEVFGELSLPLVADRPFFHRLEANGAARYSEFNNATGGVFTYSFGGQWAPVPDITFRGQYGRAVKSPTINQLFQGQADNFPGFTDYCRTAVAATNASLRASCIANGVPVSAVGTAFGSGNAQIRSVIGGNTALKEETSDTWTFGGVFQPSFIPNFTLTVDYFNVRIKDAIFQPGANDIRDACFGNQANGFTPFDRSFCALIPRNPTNFEVDGLVQLNRNAGFLQARGIDFEARYGLPLGFGIMGAEESRLNFRVSATYLLKYQFNTLASIPDLLNVCENKFGSTCGNPLPEWRGSANVTFLSGPASLNLRVFYLGPTRDDETAGTVSVTRLGARAYTDLALGFDVNENFTLRTGVNNLFDVQPQLVGDLNNEQANTYPSTFDPLGRRFFAGATVRF